ncbi:MAG: hypothetical protein FD164_1293 [Nitrospirae bacterium]|nr:MAG: hypothetical protein FD164_1293 [Nitrospirota bacterium]
MINMDINRITIRETVQPGSGATAIDLLAMKTGLSKSRLKDAMNKGAVWVQRGKKRSRLRRATAALSAGDRIELYYDEEILSLQPPSPMLIHDTRHYSVWNKPAGMLTQGTDYGDHCSLLRQAELAFGMKREVFPVHRLDREASGLVLIAHTKTAAAKLSDLFQKQQVQKIYRVVVRGIAGPPGSCRTIEIPLDSKPASSHYRVLSADAEADTSTLVFRIETGRLHQIRRHCAAIGHPVMGDPKHGSGNKNQEGMQLMAEMLTFRCPFAGRDVSYALKEGSKAISQRLRRLANRELP